MNNKLISISRDLELQIIDIFKSETDKYTIAEHITNRLIDKIGSIKNILIDPNLNTINDGEISIFINNYINNVNDFKLMLYSAFEKLHVTNLTEEVLNNIMFSVNNELQFIYKNIGILTISNMDEFQFVSHKSACPLCKYLAVQQEKGLTLLKQYFAEDDCDSYLEKYNHNTSAIKLGQIYINNVPIKFKNAIIQFLTYLNVSYYMMLRKKKQITFLTQIAMDEKTNKTDVVYFEDKDHVYIVFDLYTYKRLLIKAFFDINIISNKEEWSEIFYKLQTQDIIRNKNYINYIASETVEDFIIESIILYILEQKKLYNYNEQLYNLCYRIQLSKKVNDDAKDNI